MERKLGRNDPCWCGSGKKYKRCHMREDQKEERTRRAVPPPPPALPAEGPIWPVADEGLGSLPEEIVEDITTEDSVSVDAALTDEEWEQFIEADLEHKIALFVERVDSQQLDAEYAFEMLTTIRDESDVRHDPAARARYAELVARLRGELPDVYQHDQVFYLENLIQDAVTGERWDALPELLMSCAETAGRDLDGFSRIMDMMLYHGQTRPLFDAMDAAWVDVSQSDGIAQWGIDEFCGVLMQLSFYYYLETAESPQADDPELVDVLNRYAEPRLESLERGIQHLRASVPRAWQVEDFGQAVDAEQWEDNVRVLLLNFMADRRRAGVPLSRSELARARLWHALHQQFAQDVTQPSARSRRQRSRRGRRARRPVSPLVPARSTLERTLVDDMQFLGSRPYRAGALIELVPAYLHFLARAGLIHPAALDRALGELKPLGTQMSGLVESYGADVHLVQAIRSAWSDGALDVLRQDPALEAARAQPEAAPDALPDTAPTPRTFTFKVVYRWQPDVWFTIEMRADQTFDDLHHGILDVSDFDYDHLYAFYMSGRAWDGETEISLSSDARRTSRTPCSKLRLRLKQRFLYLYDYGDQHEFDVQLVAMGSEPPSGRYPRVLEQHGEMPAQYGDWGDDEDWDEDEQEQQDDTLGEDMQ